MRLKEGVSIAGVSPELVLGIFIINSVFTRYAKDCILTSVTDGRHREGSKHYSGEAVDIRTKHLTNEEKTEITSEIARALGKDFDVILEGIGTDNNHLHIEWDPK